MLYLDRTTEAIAHFIGLFATTVEQAWQRDAFAKFAAANDQDGGDIDLLNIATSFNGQYQLDDYEPGFVYRASAPDILKVLPWSDIAFKAPEIPVSGLAAIAYPGFVRPSDFRHGTGDQIVLPEVPIPGSVAAYISQGIELSDADYFGVGAHGLRFTPPAIDDMQIAGLFGAATHLTPFSSDDVPGNAAELKQFVVDARDGIAGFDPQPSEGETVFVQKAPSIEGTFFNGLPVDEAPKLSDHFDFEARLDAIPSADDPLPINARLTDGKWEIDVKVDADTGSNTLINNAYLKDLWAGGKVTAVVGDHFEINAIIQINAWCDSDALSAAVADWSKDTATTQAFNIATFERVDPTADDPKPDPEWGFPDNWVVKEVQGDLMIVSWLKQFTFMCDNDVGILSSSGVTTAVWSGSNVAYNDVSLSDLGFGYDLIIIGGSWYDLNIIQQMNILCDNDLVGAVAGFQTTGEGNVSTSGNLLWNHAYIYNIGANGAQPLPDCYRDAAEAFANGDRGANGGVLSDEAFQGLGTLRVLYVSGDLINVQYASQTNIVGDSDQIALAMDKIGPHPEADWTLTTGNNALVNEAVIVDLDTLGKTYVGGGEYSSDLLVQADIISTEPEYQSQNPDVLANEAVAFLTDDTLADGTDDAAHPGNLDPDNAQGDVLHTLVG